jgi:hypothetical protein
MEPPKVLVRQLLLLALLLELRWLALQRQVLVLKPQPEVELMELLRHHLLLRVVWQLPKALLVVRLSARRFRRELDQYR